ncbi:multidrug DMT transporter permease [Fluoribacter dumoffii]|uniref:Golgi nucleoside diphosphatase n=1 Tax=Fluoribacter dumoffii TaxID=463 RepID=A0A377GAJ7_9GAMM|nr:multidrug DMT transporter permease [Fluoribacter dumoffii]KTC88768.1 ectonucleoside triphosphate diphosphohydrolase [Fluoribacter dumoffii NY 23]MCW8385937.1 multidrug DMT transporter permease [Fluoribacter dumoffii]MCW8418990.1 multidrug DMT transporter permease [Fluoribacter dumoffii]MCW8453166.1 multidrug DMT transporter permease [Fluoribacter dumoffii]MCW8459616.1 multidrug DMT transporter permease [Fluoribacter dumoffii]
MLRFLLLLSSFLVVVTDINAASSSCSEHQCIAVVDAGSTGSRLHVFTYDLDETNTPSHITEIWSKKVKPGLSMIEANQNTIDAYLTTLFSGAPAQHLPVYFYATAGMRLVPKAKQKIYYQEVQNWFNQKSEWQLMDAKTITGLDEALYDWLAVNYHIGALQSSSTPSVGVMDIGGASVQIVFPIQKDVDNKGSQVDVDLYGQHISLSVHSFLGLGQNEMTHQLLDTATCFSEGYPLPDGNIGQGDAVMCEHEVSPLISMHKVKNEVQPALRANHITTWYAIGGFPNLAESKPFQFKNNQLTIQDLLQQANNLICHQSWEGLSNQFPDNEYIESYCLLPSFYYALMVEGYGLTANQTVNYVPTKQNLDWTLGVVLHH